MRRMERHVLAPADPTADTRLEPAGNRLRLWCLFGNKASMSIAQGDSIGESRILRMLSHDFDVYYNGVRLDESDPLSVGGGPDVQVPAAGDFDLHYVRANPDVFVQLPHPKVYMAYPYHEEAFRTADALVVTTEAWADLLQSAPWVRDRNDFFQRHYPPRAYIPATIIQFKQAMDPLLGPQAVSARRSSSWQLRFTNAPVSIGYAGRLDADVPRVSIEAFLNATEGSPVVYAGRIRSGAPPTLLHHDRALYVGSVPYLEMPSFYDALAMTTTQEGSNAQFLGNNKVLDSIQVGTPVITLRNRVRDEYLGRDYSGLFDTRPQALSIFKSFAADPAFREALRLETLEVAERATMASASLLARHQIGELLSAA